MQCPKLYASSSCSIDVRKTLCQHTDASCSSGQEEVRMPLTNGEGPIGLIICPSRELARQVVACQTFVHMHRRV